MTNRGTAGRYVLRYWKVKKRADDNFNKVGLCFKETVWGNNQVRWVWLRFPDKTEKAYAPSHLGGIVQG